LRRVSRFYVDTLMHVRRRRVTDTDVSGKPQRNKSALIECFQADADMVRKNKIEGNRCPPLICVLIDTLTIAARSSRVNGGKT